ncbi:hypothetical protein AVEN_224152-1 [Araneus ventricosus]|uniref:Circadian clock-controlled protein n=1 Tax=Araneus ventricosus TaxID=182803 RepID=A0A4Y2LBG7_ARAVE|nr:hypothetical protein AVEN_224152-1 [Araneus ventricosus]
MLEQNGHEYDPYVLEDSSVGFNHCSVEEEDGKLKVNGDLGAGVLDFYYDSTVKFMNFGPTIKVHGVLAYLEIHMEFIVDAKTGRNGKLTKFAIDEMKGMKVTASGLGPMNWAMNYIISGVTTLFQGFVRIFMQNKIRNHIAERLPNYQFPVEGGNIDIPKSLRN